MSAPSHRPVPRWPIRTLLVGLTLAALGIFAPGAAAQETPDVVSERELDYRSARSAHQAALDARAAAERRFNRALQEIRDAQGVEDEDRLADGYAQAQDQALELQSLDQRVREQAARLEEARTALIDALDGRIEALVAEVPDVSDPAEQQELAALIRDLNVRIRALETEGGQEETRLVALPEITWDPRDGPVELAWKAELLERRAGQYLERIEEIDSQIADLTRRQRRNRSLNDLLTGIQRFGDDQVPVVPPSEGADPQAETVEPGSEESDSTGGGRSGTTLESRIEALGLLRARIEEFREQVLFRAGQFRERAEEISL